MVDIKRAVQNATEYLHQLGLRIYSDVELEETELSEDEKFWIVTLGYKRDAIGPRKYKSFTVRASDGEVVAMKIRTVQ